MGSNAFVYTHTQHNASVLPSDPAVSLKGGESSVPAPSFGSIFDWVREEQGFTLSLLLVNHHLASEGEAILDARVASGAGVALLVGANSSVVLSLADSAAASATTIAAFTHETDPLCSAALAAPGPHGEHTDTREVACLAKLLGFWCAWQRSGLSSMLGQ